MNGTTEVVSGGLLFHAGGAPVRDRPNEAFDQPVKRTIRRIAGEDRCPTSRTQQRNDNVNFIQSNSLPPP